MHTVQAQVRQDVIKDEPDCQWEVEQAPDYEELGPDERPARVHRHGKEDQIVLERGAVAQRARGPQQLDRREEEPDHVAGHRPTSRAKPYRGRLRKRLQSQCCPPESAFARLAPAAARANAMALVSFHDVRKTY